VRRNCYACGRFLSVADKAAYEDDLNAAGACDLAGYAPGPRPICQRCRDEWEEWKRTHDRCRLNLSYAVCGGLVPLEERTP